jgi:glyoxylase I family protein
LNLVRKQEGGANTHFLADNSGDVMIEIYNNPPDQVPDYKNMNPLLLHLAFVCENPPQKRAELEAVGATFAEEVHIKDGSHLVMMRDPWGLAIQLCKRGNKMLKHQQ